MGFPWPELMAEAGECRTSSWRPPHSSRIPPVSEKAVLLQKQITLFCKGVIPWFLALYFNQRLAEKVQRFVSPSRGGYSACACRPAVPSDLVQKCSCPFSLWFKCWISLTFLAMVSLLLPGLCTSL